MVALLAGVVFLLCGAPSARAHQSPPGCLGAGLGLSLSTGVSGVHFGDSFSASVYTYNSTFPMCDAGETNASDVGAIHAWVVYSRPGGNYGVTNLVPITHPYLMPGEIYYYPNVSTYVVQAQDIITNGSYKGYIEPVPEEKSLAELGWDRPELDLKPSQMGVATQKMPL